MKHTRIILLLLILSLSATMKAQVKITHLRCEMMTNPQGIDVLQPRFSWQLESNERNVMQQEYSIKIAESKELLDKKGGEVWTYGSNSSQSHLIKYTGKPLQSGKTYFWNIISTINKGVIVRSETANFSTGLLKPTDWKAKWIGYDKASTWDSVTQWSRLSARYLRKPFTSTAKVKRATVYIVGMGLYELYINGQKIGDQVLAPNPTDYRKSVFYNTHDVTNQLRNGNNVIATVLGNGRFFTMRQDYKPQKINTFGYPKLLLQLEIEYADGKKRTIISDETWKLNVDGPIRTNNEYDGEEYDATKELKGWNDVSYNDANWIKPQLVEKPLGKIIAQSSPAMKVMKTISPLAVKEVADGKYVLDMGQNFSGWVKIKVKGKRGEKVKLRFAESLQSNGEIYVANLRDARVTDIYTLKGEGVESWHPVFVYHGFRYVEVSGFPGTPTTNDFEGMLVFDEMKTSGSFESSNATLNAIYKNAWWGIASNYKGMPVDCPQRNERQPWLGDRATGSGGEAFLFDNASLYAKWLTDIEESQTAEGAIPDVAPAFWNYYSDNMTWPGTYMLVADMLHRQYGDDRPIISHYPSMKKWMNYMRSKYMKDYIVTKDKYGDWCVPPESLQMIRSQDSTRTTKGELIATAYYYQLLKHLKKFAVMAGQPADTAAYNELSGKIRTAFQQKFFNKQRNYYDNNTVTANVLPLYFGITPDSLREEVFNNIYNKIKITDQMHISTGVIGTQWLMRMLTEFGRQDIAYALASNTSYPSWGYMAANGATTIWELWNGNTANPQMNSQNHVMLLGDLLIWLNEQVAGIRSDDNSVGFKKIIMRPVQIDELKFVNAAYETPYGKASSAWAKDASGRFEWHVSIPANTRALLYVPARTPADISGDIAVEGVKFMGMSNGFAMYETGSGNYSFISKPDFKDGIIKHEFIFERASFPESHAATIAETPNGLIAAWFGGTKEGNKDVCIWTSHLVNDKWTDPQKVADGVMNDSVRYACYNPVLYQVTNGELLLFYKIGPNVAGWTGWMIRSKDNGKTWSSREALPTGFLGPIKNKPVLIDGKLVCPSSTERNGWKVHFETTTDWGKTWTRSDSINDGKIMSAIQPSILFYPDGKLQVLCRSKNRTVNESWSTDRGKTWSPMKASPLPNNNSGTDAVSLKDGRQLIVYNHVKPAPELPNGKGPRTPLNVAISKDGINWEAVLVLEDSHISQYSYPSVIQTADGMVHIVYTWRRERVKYVKIDPSKLEGKPIVKEQWPGATNLALKPSDD